MKTCVLTKAQSARRSSWNHILCCRKLAGSFLPKSNSNVFLRTSRRRLEVSGESGTKRTAASCLFSHLLSLLFLQWVSSAPVYSQTQFVVARHKNKEGKRSRWTDLTSDSSRARRPSWGSVTVKRYQTCSSGPVMWSSESQAEPFLCHFVPLQLCVHSCPKAPLLKSVQEKKRLRARWGKMYLCVKRFHTNMKKTAMTHLTGCSPATMNTDSLLKVLMEKQREAADWFSSWVHQQSAVKFRPSAAAGRYQKKTRRKNNHPNVPALDHLSRNYG